NATATKPKAPSVPHRIAWRLNLSLNDAASRPSRAPSGPSSASMVSARHDGEDEAKGNRTRHRRQRLLTDGILDLFLDGIELVLRGFEHFFALAFEGSRTRLRHAANLADLVLAEPLQCLCDGFDVGLELSDLGLEIVRRGRRASGAACAGRSCGAVG